MSRALAFVAQGLSSGVLYALLACGLVLVYRTSRVLNFAAGELAAAGVFVVAFGLELGLPWGLSAASGLAAAAVLGAGFSLFVLEPATRRGLDDKERTLLTLALMLVLQGVLLTVAPPVPRRLDLPRFDLPFLAPPGVPAGLLAWAIAAAFAALALRHLLDRSWVGCAVRALAVNAEAARGLGLPVRRLAAGSWAVASALGATSALAIADRTLLDPAFVAEPFLKAFVAAAASGLGSFPRAITACLLLGAVEGLLSAFLPPAAKNAAAFVLLAFAAVAASLRGDGPRRERPAARRGQG